MELDYDFRYKILLVGDSGVGKSNILLRYADDKFDETYNPTVGVDYKIRTIKLGQKVYKLQIWDLSGQERFRSIISSYYRGANGIIVVYDVTNYDSFYDLRNWLDEINKHMSSDTVVMIAGNKIDCGARVVDTDQGNEFAQAVELPFMEISAKRDLDILNLFDNMIIEIGKKRDVIDLKKEVVLTDGTRIPMQESCC